MQLYVLPTTPCGLHLALATSDGVNMLSHYQKLLKTTLGEKRKTIGREKDNFGRKTTLGERKTTLGERKPYKLLATLVLIYQQVESGLAKYVPSKESSALPQPGSNRP